MLFDGGPWWICVILRSECEKRWSGGHELSVSEAESDAAAAAAAQSCAAPSGNHIVLLLFPLFGPNRPEGGFRESEVTPDHRASAAPAPASSAAWKLSERRSQRGGSSSGRITALY